MKKIIGAALVAVLSLTACGGNDEPAPRETVFVEKDGGSNGDSQQDIAEQAFLDAVHENVNGSSDVPDETLIELGVDICSDIDNGASLESVVETGIDAGVSPEDVGFIVGASVGAFCPQHEDLVEEFADRYSNDVLTG